MPKAALRAVLGLSMLASLAAGEFVDVAVGASSVSVEVGAVDPIFTLRTSSNPLCLTGLTAIFYSSTRRRSSSAIEGTASAIVLPKRASIISYRRRASTKARLFSAFYRSYSY